ncbi:MAG: GNAT family N-acetyltransferase [Frankia sp.]|nr:GNAT family N-acetyltransferase [Frankia sp.]
MDNLRIRPVETSDLPGLLDMYRQLGEDAPGVPHADPGEALRIIARIQINRSRHLLVADVDGRPVGTADLLVVDNLTHFGQSWGIVDNVIVDAPWRGFGVGRALLTEVVARARAANCYKIQLMARNDLVEAHRFFDGLGFERFAAGFRLYLTE